LRGAASAPTWSSVEEYFKSRLLSADPILDAALEASAAAGLPPIQVSASQGKLLHLLALAHGSRRILEVGTLGGYSTLWLARALSSDGHLLTLELEPRHAEVARRNFVRAGVAERIELHVGPALATLTRLRAEQIAPFDFVFIDADKPNNLSYVQAALDMSRAGTLIVRHPIEMGFSLGHGEMPAVLPNDANEQLERVRRPVSY
jgi:predicted O-methyltransferase YrrM